MSERPGSGVRTRITQSIDAVLQARSTSGEKDEHDESELLDAPGDGPCIDSVEKDPVDHGVRLPRPHIRAREP